MSHGMVYRSSTMNRMDKTRDCKWIIVRSIWSMVFKFLIFTAGQACSPWFDMRPGFCTGTTSKTVLWVLKHEWIDSDIEDADFFFLILGVKCNKPFFESLATEKVSKIKKSFLKLGYVVKKVPAPTMISALTNKMSSPCLVFQKAVKAWSMTDTNKKSNWDNSWRFSTR